MFVLVGAGFKPALLDKSRSGDMLRWGGFETRPHMSHDPCANDVPFAHPGPSETAYAGEYVFTGLQMLNASNSTTAMPTIRIARLTES